MTTRWPVLLSLIAALILWPNLAQTESPEYGGTLRIALAGDATFFNAHQGPAPGSHTAWIAHNLYNSLLTLTPPPELKVVPELAKSWEVLDAGRSYVFHLQEGVAFHDGTDFDAHAAKWNFDRILDPKVNSWVQPYYDGIEAVEVVDRYTLRVRMKEPFGALHRELAGYFQGIPMASPKAFELYGEQWTRHPTGTGPYKLKVWVPNERIVLEKNPHYFKKGLPYLDNLEFMVMRDPHTASAALQMGIVDLMARVPLRQAIILEKTPDVQVVTGPEMAPVVAFLNMRIKPFDDVRARRAVVGYGINRAQIARLGFDGRVAPLVSILPIGVPDAINLNEMYPYRPEEAKRLLQELGYDATHPLKLTLRVPNHDLTLADIAMLIANQLEKINVQAKIVILDATAWVERILIEHDFEMAVSNWANVLDINMRSVSFFKDGASNYTGIDDPALEAMVRQWRRALTAEDRQRLSADMQRLIATQLYWMNVSGYPFYQAYRTYVRDYPFYNQAYLFLERVWIEQ